jgi:uncharacterized RDD family membrane protein YckC
MGALRAASTKFERSANGVLRRRQRLERAAPLAHNGGPFKVHFPPEQEPTMSQAARMGVEPITMDPYEIGWYIESADEETYGPVSREALRRFLQEKTITLNTLVRHCTQPEAKPVADQPLIREHLSVDAKGSALGDRLAEAWPRKKRDQQALAAGSLPCAWHKGPAVLVCVRCHAPHCNRCRAKPFRKQFYFCRRCQTGVYNRRFVALVVDNLVIVYVPLIAAGAVLTALGVGQLPHTLLVYLLDFALVGVFFGRDSLFGGAGAGKRMVGLRVVQSKDGSTPLTYGQGVLRWLSVLIPFFNLVDVSIPYRDPLLRRFGDRWAGTRVIDTEQKLAKDREKTARRLIKKGVQPAREFGMSMARFARIV